MATKKTCSYMYHNKIHDSEELITATNTSGEKILICKECAKTFLYKCSKCGSYAATIGFTDHKCNRCRNEEEADILDYSPGRRYHDIPLSFLQGDFTQFPIPMNIIVREPSDLASISFTMGRRYEIGWYLHQGNIVNYQFLELLHDFKGTSDFKEVYLEEIWDNDGESCFSLHGWQFVTKPFRDPFSEED